MATFRICEDDAARDVPGLLEWVRGGDEVIVESDSAPAAIFQPVYSSDGTVQEIRARLLNEARND